MAVHDLAGNCKAEPRAPRFSGKERFENLFQIVIVDTSAVIFHREFKGVIPIPAQAHCDVPVCAVQGLIGVYPEYLRTPSLSASCRLQE